MSVLVSDFAGALQPRADDDHEDSPNRFAQKFAISTIILVVPTILVFLRTYTRFVVLKKHAWEDYIILLAWSVFFGGSLALIIGTAHTLGVHIDDVSRTDVPGLLKWLVTGQILSAPGMGLTKIAVIVQIGAIFVSSKNRLYWTLWILGIAQAVLWTIYMFIRIFECSPRERGWMRVEAHCIEHTDIMVYFSVGFNTLTDFILWGIAVRKTWRLRMDFKEKTMVSLIFLVGLFGCVCGVMRILISYMITRNGADADISWVAVEFYYWVTGEMACCLIVCCLPTLRFYAPAVRRTLNLLGNHPCIRSTAAKFQKASPRRWPMAKHSSTRKGLFDDLDRTASSISTQDTAALFNKIPSREYMPNRSARYDYEKFDDPGAAQSHPTPFLPLCTDKDGKI